MTENLRRPTSAGISRRRFLTTGAALAGTAALSGYLPPKLLQAARASTATGSFDLSQVKHVVMLMMENRSFDHYFGTFPGVRGFSDPNAGTLGNGNSVFRQPDPDNPNSYVEPFHLDTIRTGAAATPSLSHAWEDQHGSWNNGAMDGWIRTHTESDGVNHGTYTMGYYTGVDIPFHWALARNFTLLDHYHCSVLACTYPNRFMWLTGTIDPQGVHGGPALDNNYTNYSFTTAAEVLLNAGYTFKCYQQSDNYATNVLEYFSQTKAAATNSALHQGIFSVSTLWGNGTPGGQGNPTSPTAASDPTQAFEEDCANGTLPDVSWIFTTSAASEHPDYLPAAGAKFIASKLEALAANENLWNETVFIINYDENDGYFDHVAPPTPDPTTYPEEFVHLHSPGGTPGNGYPIGAGFRVPCFLVSPWTTGGNVFSELSDHTSGLQFIEAVTAAGGLSAHGPVTFSNISNWRRATFGNFLNAFPGGTTPQPAPTDPQFTTATTSSNLSAQTAASKQPLPAFPGATQSTPSQSAG